LEKKIRNILQEALANKKSGVLLDVAIESMFMIISSHGRAFAEDAMEKLVADIPKLLSPDDAIIQHERDRLYILLVDHPEGQTESLVRKLIDHIQVFACTAMPEPICMIPRIGASFFNPNQNNTPESIEDQAYIALQDARDSNRHYTSYHDRRSLPNESRNRLILATYLQDALLNKKLRLAFQPIVSAHSGEVAYHESLLRVIDSHGQPISAGPFIPVAEKMGFIHMLDAMVLQMVVDEMRASPQVKLSLNVSNETIAQSEWLTMAMKLLAQEDIAKRLIVEITETTEIKDFRKTERFIKTLKDLGCQIALDDFGAGFTSFSHLKKLQIDLIKIDGAFVRDVAESEKSRHFIRTLLDFTQGLNLRTVAEFVESMEIAEVLRSMKVDFLQGNFFSPAVSYRSWVGK
jgi:EAL domain-containing protein (putative c-di-GMP-specific phosphodiesterase class I)/GGDEF domain-containing protein